MTVAVIAEGIEVVYPGPPPVEALRGVSLQIETGEFVAIVGPSGSGKSSLLHVLGALMPPTVGRVYVADKPLEKLNRRRLNALRANEMGFVFQEFHLVGHRTVQHNVMIGSLYQGHSLRRRRHDALEALKDVGILHLAGSRPNRLSGGERQRVGIARALIGRPRLLLCDEPTGNLDSATTATIIELLDQLRRERDLTVVVVTHDPIVQQAVDRTITLRDGVVIP